MRILAANLKLLWSRWYQGLFWLVMLVLLVEILWVGTFLLGTAGLPLILGAAGMAGQMIGSAQRGISRYAFAFLLPGRDRFVQRISPLLGLAIGAYVFLAYMLSLDLGLVQRLGVSLASLLAAIAFCMGGQALSAVLRHPAFLMVLFYVSMYLASLGQVRKVTRLMLESHPFWLSLDAVLAIGLFWRLLGGRGPARKAACLGPARPSAPGSGGTQQYLQRRLRNSPSLGVEGKASLLSEVCLKGIGRSPMAGLQRCACDVCYRVLGFVPARSALRYLLLLSVFSAVWLTAKPPAIIFFLILPLFFIGPHSWNKNPLLPMSRRQRFWCEFLRMLLLTCLAAAWASATTVAGHFLAASQALLTVGTHRLSVRELPAWGILVSVAILPSFYTVEVMFRKRCTWLASTCILWFALGLYFGFQGSGLPLWAWVAYPASGFAFAFWGMRHHFLRRDLA